MLGVKEDFFRPGTQKCHGIPDDIQISGRLQTQSVAGMTFAGLAENGQNPCAAGKQRHERGIVFRRM